MDRWAAVAAGALLLTAGCSAFAADDPGTPTATVTPVPVTPTTEAPTATGTTFEPATLPPGVGPNGSVSVGTLALAHREYLADRSYTLDVRYNATAVGGDGETFETYDRTVKVANGSRYLDRTRRETVRTNRTAYVDATGEYVRIELNDNATYRYSEDPVGREFFAFLVTDWLRKYLSVPSSQLARVERGDRTLYRLYTTDTPLGLLTASDRHYVRNFTMTAYVTPEGFLRALRVAYDRHQGETRRHVRLTVDYRAVGATTVAEPAWVARQKRNGTTPSNGSVPTPP